MTHPPVCNVSSHSNVSISGAPLRKMRRVVNSAAFFVKLANNDQVHIVTNARSVACADFLTLEVYDEQGTTVTCRAVVRRFYGSCDVALLEIDSTITDDLSEEEKLAMILRNKKFHTIASERALELYSGNHTFKELSESNVFVPIYQDMCFKNRPVNLEGFSYLELDFSKHPYTNLVATALDSLAYGSPWILQNSKRQIIGITLAISDNKFHALPWFLLKVLLQAEVEDKKIRGLCAPLFSVQPLRNPHARACNGLISYKGGQLINTIHPCSSLFNSVTIGDILLKINNKIVTDGRIYNPVLDMNLHFSSEFEGNPVDSEIRLLIGRKSIDENGKVSLQEIEIIIKNNRYFDDKSALNLSGKDEVIIISGYQFIAEDRYRLSTQTMFFPHVKTSILERLQKESKNINELEVNFGELPIGCYQAELHQDLLNCAVTHVDGIKVKNFEHFRQLVRDNLARNEKGVLLIVGQTDRAAGRSVFIKHVSDDENKNISVKYKLPYNLFLMSTPKSNEKLVSDQNTQKVCQAARLGLPPNL